MCNALPRLFGSVAVLTTPLGSFSAYSLSLAMSVSFQIWTGEVLLLVNEPHIIRNLEQSPRRSYRNQLSLRAFGNSTYLSVSKGA